VTSCTRQPDSTTTRAASSISRRNGRRVRTGTAPDATSGWVRPDPTVGEEDQLVEVEGVADPQQGADGPGVADAGRTERARPALDPGYSRPSSWVSC